MQYKTIDATTQKDLDDAAEEFLAAARKYREFLKRNYRDRLAGVMILKSSGMETLIYTESEKYAQQIDALTFDWNKDKFVLERQDQEQMLSAASNTSYSSIDHRRPYFDSTQPVDVDAVKRANVGSHYYPGAEGGAISFYTSDCEHGCGCWCGLSRSGGPDGADPLGVCPNNRAAEPKPRGPNS